MYIHAGAHEGRRLLIHVMSAIHVLMYNHVVYIATM